MGFRVIQPSDLEFETRSHEPDEAPRHAAGVTELAGFTHTRANFFRYEPGAHGRRHKDMLQEETYVPVRGTLTMYLGEPPERHEVPVGGLIHVEPGTALQTVNHGSDELVLYVYGTPPEDEHAEILTSTI